MTFQSFQNVKLSFKGLDTIVWNTTTVFYYFPGHCIIDKTFRKNLDIESTLTKMQSNFSTNFSLFNISHQAENMGKSKLLWMLIWNLLRQSFFSILYLKILEKISSKMFFMLHRISKVHNGKKRPCIKLNLRILFVKQLISIFHNENKNDLFSYLCSVSFFKHKIWIFRFENKSKRGFNGLRLVFVWPF